jgi:hypothetical protein
MLLPAATIFDTSAKLGQTICRIRDRQFLVPCRCGAAWDHLDLLSWNKDFGVTVSNNKARPLLQNQSGMELSTTAKGWLKAEFGFCL